MFSPDAITSWNNIVKDFPFIQSFDGLSLIRPDIGSENLSPIRRPETFFTSAKEEIATRKLNSTHILYFSTRNS